MQPRDSEPRRNRPIPVTPRAAHTLPPAAAFAAPSSSGERAWGGQPATSTGEADTGPSGGRGRGPGGRPEIPADPLRARALARSVMRSVAGFRKRLPKVKAKALVGPGLLLLAIALILTWFALLRGLKPITETNEMSLTRLSRLARERAVATAKFYDEDATVIVETTSGARFFTRLTKSDAITAPLVDELKKSGAQVTVDPQSDKAFRRPIVQWLLPLLILAAVFSFFFMLITGQSGGAAEFFQFSKMLARVTRRKKGKGEVNFDSVAAVDEAIVELQEVVDYLMHPERFTAMGAKAPKGVLLVGPPGTGKTLLARAVSGEANVPFYSMAGSEFVEALVGVGAARVRDLFRRARDNAPCLIFIDELDAAGRQRGAGVGQGNDEREQTLNQMLAEMDGFDVSAGICVMGATNRPDILDPALLRPGRFDRQVVIDVPDLHGRFEILKVHARGRPMAPDADLMTVARQTPGFTGAELANVMNEAALLAVRRGHTGIADDDLDEAVERTVAGPERRGHLLSESEKRLVAHHEAGHAIVARAVGQKVGIQKLSIVARGRQLGHATVYQQADKLVLLRSEVEAELASLLAGLAAENTVFGEVSSGSTRDLEQATELARKIVATWGMTEEVGRMSIQKEGALFLGRDAAHMGLVSQAVLQKVDFEVRRLLDEAEKRAERIITQNREVLDRIVEALLERETLSHDDVEPFLAEVESPPASGRPAARGGKAASTPISRVPRTRR